MHRIEVRNLKKRFGQLQVLEDVSFTVDEGDVVAIIGPSGAGKSTMLRCLIHLEELDGGSIYVEGEALLEQGVYAPKQKRREIMGKMGMVFQSFNLFPHWTVEKNLIRPLMTVKGVEKKDAMALSEELLAKVGLAEKRKAYPKTLSGGQQQRVAIARALMMSPDILLFDEPTSALDPQLTGEVLQVMQQLAREKVTMLVVTHEMRFAKEAASKVLFMSDGRITEQGTPREVMENPRHPRTISFLQSERSRGL